MHRMVKVVVPVRVEAPLDDRLRIVEIVLADDREAPIEVTLERADLVDELCNEVALAVVVERMDRVEAQAVGAEVAQPGERAVDQEAAHLRAAGVVEVD